MDPKKNSRIAERNYEGEDYKRNDQMSKGLAETHEQVSDSYMDGDNDEEQTE